MNPAILRKLKPGDILVTSQGNYFLRLGSRILMGSYVGHNLTVLDKKGTLLESTAWEGTHLSDLDRLAMEHKQVHVYRLKKKLVNNKEMKHILAKLKGYYRNKIPYSKKNATGLVIYSRITGLEHIIGFRILKTKKDLSADSFLYRPDRVTCSQMVLRAILESCSTAKRREAFYKAMGYDDIRSFFPTRFENVCDYQFTIWLRENKTRRLNPKELRKMNKRGLY